MGTLPVAGNPEELKQTNEIKMAIPLLEAIDISGKDISADALLTQRELAHYLIGRGAHYHFTTKGNQPTLLDDLTEYFKPRQGAHYVQTDPPDHGRIEKRSIWTPTALNDYRQFPHVAQAFCIERELIEKKSGEFSRELAYGITSRPPAQANAQRLLQINRGHWSIESCHWMIDWNYDEDRSRIRTGHGPENMTRLRRFAITLIKAKITKTKKAAHCVAQKMRQLNWNIRLVFDYLSMNHWFSGCGRHRRELVA